MATATATATDHTTGLTSTTAPGKVFTSRDELATHYQTPWHQYNLKRRQAGLPVLLEADFQARLAAAQALRQETKTAGKDHLKKDKKHKKSKKTSTADGAVISSQVPTYDSGKGVEGTNDTAALESPNDRMDVSETPVATTVGETTPETDEEEMMVEIDPLQCLFDRHMSSTVEANAERMYRKYGFFIPDREYCVDLEGMIGYLHEKIKLGNMCVYCHKVFTTWQGCQKHMIQKQHTKMRYEAGVDLDDFDVFYDFVEENEQFWQSVGGKRQESATNDGQNEAMDGIEEDGDEEDGWEDISDDEEAAEDNMDEDDDNNSIYSEFEEEVARMGIDVTPLGELVFPNGRIVGHRSLRKYYKQRTAQREDTRESVVAARRGAGERLYRGRVYQVGDGSSTASQNPLDASRAVALSRAGMTPELTAGRAGKGILVSTKGGSNFTQLSVYRFRAVVKKQRREDARGKRLFDRTACPINKWDKKGNRMLNGVSVAHAKR
jgi:pre-60S factor REI1